MPKPERVLHTLPQGWVAASLYLATRDVELEAMAGRWRAKSISAYLREIIQLLAGLGGLNCGKPSNAPYGKKTAWD